MAYTPRQQYYQDQEQEAQPVHPYATTTTTTERTPTTTYQPPPSTAAPPPPAPAPKPAETTTTREPTPLERREDTGLTTFTPIPSAPPPPPPPGDAGQIPPWLAMDMLASGQGTITGTDPATMPPIQLADELAQPAASQAQPPAPQEDPSNMWANMMADYDASLGGKVQQTYADEARFGRQADATNAMLGRGVSGGGSQAAQAQVALGGMQQRQDVVNKHTQRGFEMKMARLDQLMRQAEAAKDRDMQQRISDEMNKTQLLIAGSGIDTTEYAGGAGGGPQLNPDNPGAKDVWVGGDTVTVDTVTDDGADNSEWYLSQEGPSGNNGWHAINKLIDSYNLSRRAIDAAKAYQIAFFSKNDSWARDEVLMSYLQEQGLM